jgi:PAS domain S-box-containing protein
VRGRIRHLLRIRSGLQVFPTVSTIDAKPTPPRLSRHRDGLRLILETALDAVIVMTSDGVVTDWNDCAIGVFGWSRGEAIGRTMAELIIPERYRNAHRAGLRRYLESGQGEILGRRIEVSGLRKNGEEFPVELSISPPQEGERILFAGCLRDITERNALHLARVELRYVLAKGGNFGSIRWRDLHLGDAISRLLRGDTRGAAIVGERRPKAVAASPIRAHGSASCRVLMKSSLPSTFHRISTDFLPVAFPSKPPALLGVTGFLRGERRLLLLVMVSSPVVRRRGLEVANRAGRVTRSERGVLRVLY